MRSYTDDRQILNSQEEEHSTNAESNSTDVNIIVVILVDRLVSFINRALEGYPLSTGVFDVFYVIKKIYLRVERVLRHA